MEQKKTRRKRGTGNVYQKSDGTWLGRITVGKEADGRPKIKYFSGKTEAEVKRKIRDFNKSNELVDYKKVSLEEYLNNWLSVYKRAELKNTSLTAWNQRLEITSSRILVICKWRISRLMIFNRSSQTQETPAFLIPV